MAAPRPFHLVFYLGSGKQRPLRRVWTRIQAYLKRGDCHPRLLPLTLTAPWFPELSACVVRHAPAPSSRCPSSPGDWWPVPTAPAAPAWSSSLRPGHPIPRLRLCRSSGVPLPRMKQARQPPHRMPFGMPCPKTRSLRIHREERAPPCQQLLRPRTVRLRVMATHARCRLLCLRPFARFVKLPHRQPRRGRHGGRQGANGGSPSPWPDWRWRPWEAPLPGCKCNRRFFP